MFKSKKKNIYLKKYNKQNKNLRCWSNKNKQKNKPFLEVMKCTCSIQDKYNNTSKLLDSKINLKTE